MSQPVIQVRDLGKLYRIFRSGSLTQICVRIWWMVLGDRVGGDSGYFRIGLG